MTTEVREATETPAAPTEEQAESEQDADLEIARSLSAESTAVASSEPGDEGAESSEQEAEPEDKELANLIKLEREAAAAEAEKTALQKAEAEKQAKEQEEAQVNQKLGLARAYNQRLNNIAGAFNEARVGDEEIRLQDGRTVSLKDYVLAQFRYQNGQYADAFTVGLIDAVAAELPESEQESFKTKALKGDFGTTRGMAKAFRDILAPLIESEAKKDTVSKAEYDAAEERGRVKFIRQYRTDEDFRRSLETQVKTGHNLGNGASGGGRVPSLAQYNAASYEQRQAWKKDFGEDYADRIVQAGR